MPTRSPRSLADHVRGWSSDQLAALLRARPDLAMPAPADSGQLAARATSRASIWRAFELCDSADRAVLEAASSVESLTPAEIAPLIGATVEETERIVGRLSDLLLLWDDGTGLRVPRPLAEQLAVPPGPPLSTIAGLVGELDAEPEALLRHLVSGQLEGTSAVDPGSPAAMLVALGLLGTRGDGDGVGTARQRRLTVTFSTRQHFLDGRITNRPAHPPTIATTATKQSTADEVGAGSAAVMLRHVEAIAEAWSRRPPLALRSGGLGVRDFKALCKHLNLDAHEAALLLEAMHAAGLLRMAQIAQGGEDVDAWMPTVAFDEWSRSTPGARWTHLVRAWLGMHRQPTLVGTRGPSGAVNALSPDVEHPTVALVRRQVIAEWAHTPSGTRLAAGTGTATLLAALSWRHPQRGQVDGIALDAMTEAAWLGITALDAVTTQGRAVLADEDAATILDRLLPPAVDHVLIQADLTAIAPGPLEHDLAERLAEIADVDSRGGATVYRFAADSVRRGLDAGRTASEIKEFLASASKTPVPQALTYLIDDVARRFGALRVGAAQVFLRSDDEVAIAELLHDARASSLRLRRIAPTVLVSDLDPATVLMRLRELGAAPVLEAADGTVHVARPDLHRAPSARLGGTSDQSGLKEARIAATVAAIQSGDRAAVARPANTVAHAPNDIVALLRRALDASLNVVLAYAGPDGTVSQRVVRPLRLEGGRLTAFDERSDLRRDFLVHRITAAAPAD
ncbi:MAG: helicase-associated domain-containing protein [Marmoricola sp.]